MCLFSNTLVFETYMIRKPVDLQIYPKLNMEPEAISIRFNGGFNRKWSVNRRVLLLTANVFIESEILFK